jgi:hypothetical protein
MVPGSERYEGDALSFTIGPFVGEPRIVDRDVREFKPSHPGGAELLQPVKDAVHVLCERVKELNVYMFVEANGFVTSEGNAEIRLVAKSIRRVP